MPKKKAKKRTTNKQKKNRRHAPASQLRDPVELPPGLQALHAQLAPAIADLLLPVQRATLALGRAVVRPPEPQPSGSEEAKTTRRSESKKATSD
jgi:hypothetical protein